MLSLSPRPVVVSSLLKPKPRLLPKLIASASAFALTPPSPQNPRPDPDPAPLFLRPPAHRVSAASLAAFRRRAAALIPPSAPHLHRHLRWLLADAATDPTSDPALLRAPLHDLEALWLCHVRGRRPFQYVVGNEHWRDLVVAVREGVLIPRPETEAVVDMVGRVKGFEAGWWADLGTGSGAIAVAVARMMGPEGRVFATDASEGAIEVARLNVDRYGMQVREFICLWN